MDTLVKVLHQYSHWPSWATFSKSWRGWQAKGQGRTKRTKRTTGQADQRTHGQKGHSDRLQDDWLNGGGSACLMNCVRRRRRRHCAASFCSPPLQGLSIQGCVLQGGKVVRWLGKGHTAGLGKHDSGQMCAVASQDINQRISTTFLWVCVGGRGAGNQRH